MTVPSCDLAIVLDTACAEICQQLAEQLCLPLVTEQSEQYAFYLLFTEAGLALQQSGNKAPGPVRVDFVGGAASHRRKQGGGELLVKAMGGDKQQRPTVVDATAGLGRDSFVLASWGFPVVMCERSAIIAALLRDGLQRAQCEADDELQSVLQRMSLQASDALAYLREVAATEAPDIVYIDPMFPVSGKSALVKKEMRAFHQVVGSDVDNERLLQAARDVAIHRVVVKRPKKAEPWMQEQPSFSVSGKAVRFDIYAKKAFAKK